MSEENDNGFYRYCQPGMVNINPDDISNFAEEIMIIGNPITTILNGTFSKKQSRISSLAYNKIHSLQPLAFQQMYSLEELHLNHNFLSELPDGIFEEINGQNPTLTHLYMQHNRLTTLRARLFSRVTTLIYLDLQENPLVTISEAMAPELAFIDTVFIGIHEGIWRNVYSADVPESISSMSEENDSCFYRYCQTGMVNINPDDISNFAMEIMIIGNPITTILDGTFSRKQSRILSLAYNKIHSLQPLAFQQMYSLEELHLNHNFLSELPDGIFEEINGQNPTLTHLYMQHNRLTTLRARLFSRVTTLIYLDLQENPLVAISEAMAPELAFIDSVFISTLEGIWRNVYSAGLS